MIVTSLSKWSFITKYNMIVKYFKILFISLFNNDFYYKYENTNNLQRFDWDCLFRGRQSPLCERIWQARHTAGHQGTVDHCIPPPFYLTSHNIKLCKPQDGFICIYLLCSFSTCSWCSACTPWHRTDIWWGYRPQAWSRPRTTKSRALKIDRNSNGFIILK